MNSIRSQATDILKRTDMAVTRGQTMPDLSESQGIREVTTLQAQLRAELQKPTLDQIIIRDITVRLMGIFLTYCKSPAEFREFAKLWIEINGYKPDRRETIRVENLSTDEIQQLTKIASDYK